jgi:hypothetical protein
MMRRSKLLTSSAQNDAAVGAFVGFLSTLFFVCGAFGLAERLQPPSSTSGPNDVLSLLLLLPVGLTTGVVFTWLRRHLADFARGYRRGALIIAVIFGALYLRSLFWWIP